MSRKVKHKRSNVIQAIGHNNSAKEQPINQQQDVLNVHSFAKMRKIKEKDFFNKIFAFLFALSGVSLLAISIWSGDIAIRSSAMDFFKLWLGALISIVSVMCTHYYRDSDNDAPS